VKSLEYEITSEHQPRATHEGMIPFSWRLVRWLTAGVAAAIVYIAILVHPPHVFIAHTLTDLTTGDASIGFFPAQTDNRGLPYAWTEPRAVTKFSFVGNRPFHLVLTLRSAALAGGPDSPIDLLVNGVERERLRPDPNNTQFEVFRIPLASVSGGDLTVRLQAEPFHPQGDPRTLGTVVQRIAIDRSDAWSAMSRRLWLYGMLPLLGLLSAICTAIPWRAQHSSDGASRVAWLRSVALIACLVGALGMLAAIAILLHMGRIDEYRYGLWLFGSLYLAGFFSAAAVHLPIGATEPRSLWATFQGSTFVRRHRRAVSTISNAILFTLVTLLALSFIESSGTGDVGDKLRWMRNIVANGLVGGFHVSRDDYPPGTYAILAVLTKIGPGLGMGSFLAYKLSIFAFLLAACLIAWLWTRNAPFTIALELALIVDSAVLGYNDAYFVAPLLLALWALQRKRIVAFSILFTLTCLMKWQPLILAPILLIYLLKAMTLGADRRRELPRLICALILPSVAILVAMFAIFGPEFVAAFRRGTNEHFLSANALNVDWIVTQGLRWWDPQRFSFGPSTHRQYISIPSATLLTAIKLPFAIIYLGILIRFIRDANSYATMLRYACIGYFAYFLFNTSVHENHLVPAVIIAGLLWTMDERYGPLFLFTAAMLNVNLLLFYQFDGIARLPVLFWGMDVSIPLALLNAALFVLLLIHWPLRHGQLVRLPRRASRAGA
jgi:Gpi18-like mannosyltransferase